VAPYARCANGWQIGTRTVITAASATFLQAPIGASMAPQQESEE
jgi:hypothetical protein